MKNGERIQFDICLIGGKKKKGRFITWVSPRGNHILYIVRAGVNGKGREMARASCVFNYYLQKAALEKIRAKLKGLIILNGDDEE
jgi:hypothetical protein